MMRSSDPFCQKQNAERDTDDHQRDDQPNPQLVEVIHQRQLLIVADAAQRRAQRT